MKTIAKSIASITFVFALAPASAQTPYAGMQSRPIKALSDLQVADLRAGRGMGLALAAQAQRLPGSLARAGACGPIGIERRAADECP